jgi:hypothetical protein
MRDVMKSSLSAMAALIIGSATVGGFAAFAASGQPRMGKIQIAQAEGDKPAADRGGKGDSGDRGDRGDRAPRSDRGGRTEGGPRTERAPKADNAPGAESAPRAQAPRAERGEVGRRMMERPHMDADRAVTRREMAPDRRYSRDRRDDRRRERARPGHRSDFMFLGGSRVIVRNYGPGWCRGLHRGYHRAPGLGWHGQTHRGLFRC